MSDDAATRDVPERWLKVTRTRERHQEHLLAVAHAEAARRRQTLAELDARHDQQLREVSTGRQGVVSTAELMLVSEGLAVTAGRRGELVKAVEQAKPAVDSALAALGEASRARLVAEKWRNEKRAEWVKEVDRKLDRAQSDRFGSGQRRD
jgi:hypothetical protein